MNLPSINIKEILSKLSVLKDNKSLLIPIIIVFISILPFIPAYLINSKLKKQIEEESIAKLKQIERLSENSISPQQLEIEQQNLDAQVLDVNEIVRLSVQTTKRQLLRNDIFNLDPNDPNSIFSRQVFQQFGQEYREGIDAMIAKVSAGDCPTEVELERTLEESGASSRIKQERSLGYFNSDNTGQQTDDLTTMIYDQICLQRARSLNVYADPIDLSNYYFWENFQYNQAEEAIETCWYSQLAYWVIEDIFDTIDSMNSEHENVLDAPVKRLIGLTFQPIFRRVDTSDNLRISTRSSDETDRNLDLPKYIMSLDEGLIRSYTGRYTKDDIDVIHFKVKFVIDKNALMPLINELYKAKEHIYIDDDGTRHTYLHNQLTILNSKSEYVNPNYANHLYYRYGEGGIIELELTCEYIFNRKGYEDIMPKSIKTKLLEAKEQI
jgi:hypothetical protein